MSLLFNINDPSDLRRLTPQQLHPLCDELRDYLLQQVARTGGHLSSNLGTVELTVALHYVFNTPHDRLVWDVGHQTYVHKILTGRREAMSGLRQLGGISGFPRRSESPYDAFGTAHSSTSISAALGMAVAAKRLGLSRKHVAVIGDGAMTAGMAFEALNNAGVMPDADLLVVLNDNDMSISPPVGALNKYLARLLSGSAFGTAKALGKGLLQLTPPLKELAHRLEEHMKGMVAPSTLFEEMGFDYFGPIDGHDLDALLPTLQNLKAKSGPILLHVITKKGAGYKLAEADPVLYHGPGRFDPSIGIVQKTGPKPMTYTQVFGQWLCDMAKHDAKLMAITPAMREGSGLVEFEKQYPDRYFDVGIAEQHALTFAAGLACDGLKPVVAIYSTFLQRAYDQFIHDIALQNLDVTFAIDRAGLVGADGATHAGSFDMAFLRCVPNIIVAAPSDELECRLLLSTAYQYPGCAAVRYPRGVGTGINPLQMESTPYAVDETSMNAPMPVLPLGKAILRFQPEHNPNGLVLFAFGTMVHVASQVGKALQAHVVDMRWVKPIDEAMVLMLAAKYPRVVTLEEGCVMGGAGSAVLECLMKHATKPDAKNELKQWHGAQILQIGLPDRFIDHGEVHQLLAQNGLDPEGVMHSIQSHFPDVFTPSLHVGNT